MEAREIIKDLPDFSFEAFERKMLSKGAQYKNVFKAFEYHINLLKTQEGLIHCSLTKPA